MRRVISICLIFCMVFSTFAGAVVMDTSGDKAEMENVLVKVKSKIEIDKKYSEFSYRYNSQNENSYWIFTWGWPNNGDIQIQADDQGRIISYRKWSYTGEKVSNAPEFTRAQAQEKADAFAKKAVPEIYGAMGKNPVYTVNSQSRCYAFTYNRYENGVPCINQQVSMRVNYVTGDVENMSVEWLYDVEFEKVANPITQEDAKNTWKDKTELELKYLYDLGGIDSVGKTVKAFLAYVPVEDTKSVNAQTGEILEKEYEWVYDSGFDNAVTEDAMVGSGAAGSTNNKVEFSEKELEKLSEHENLLTLYQADKKVREFTELSLDASFRISSSNLMADSYAYPVVYGEQEGVGYSWRIVYSGPVEKEKVPKSIYVTIDAVTGELESYRDYETDDLSADMKASLTLTQACAVSDKFIKKVSKDKSSKVLKAEDTEVSAWNSKGNQVQAGWNFKYNRANEGIPTESDSIRVSVNRMTGKVTSYMCTWQERVEFESTSGIISKADAVAAYIDNAKANLEYHIFTTYLYDVEEGNSDNKTNSQHIGFDGKVRNKKSTILVYSFESPSAIISAKSGKYIDYSGAEVKVANKGSFAGYSDIGGHYAKREISLLADIGVLPQREKFMPYQNVKQKEFLYYLFMGANSYRMYTADGIDDAAVIDEVYSTAVNAGVITEKEINREASVSRYQAIRFLVRYMGLGKIASDYMIFKVGFNDALSIPKEYLGFVAIGKSMQIIGGSNGNFNGSRNLTNGDAAKMIYNTLKKSAEY